MTFFCCCITLISDSQFHSHAAEAPVKYESDVMHLMQIMQNFCDNEFYVFGC